MSCWATWNCCRQWLWWRTDIREVDRTLRESVTLFRFHKMTYLKATAAGIVTAVIFAVVWACAVFLLPIWWQMWQQRNQGVGAAGSYVDSGSILLAAVIGFILGFLVTLRISH